MAEFVEVMKDKDRMCRQISCTTCKLKMLADSKCLESCAYYGERYPQKAEKIIMQWAKEHPIQTMLSKFVEVFGEENIKYTVSLNDDFWVREYKAPTEEVEK